MTFEALHVAAANDEWHTLSSIEFRRHNHGLIARVNDSTTRTHAEQLRNNELAVRRKVLPEPRAGEIYWVDLIGLTVVNTSGEVLGHVNHVIDNGASAVLDASGAGGHYLIPLVKPILVSVDQSRQIEVDWDADWTA